MIGWTAAEGRVSALGWILFGLLFFWQIPHFMAIAWTYRRDYTAVHFPMLSVRDDKGGVVAAWSFATTLGLVAVSMMPWAMGLATAWSGGVAVADMGVLPASDMGSLTVGAPAWLGIRPEHMAVVQAGADRKSVV